MTYNDSQLFALTRSQYINRAEEVQEDSQEVTMTEKIEMLRSLGYTTEASPEKINEGAQEVQPLKVRANSHVVKDGVTYIVKESLLWNERRYTFKTIAWTISADLECSGHNLELNEVSAKTLKELKLKLAQEGFSTK